MKRRLYFLLPDVANARSAVAELERNDIARNSLHVIAAKGIDLEDLPRASHNQRSDLGARLVTIFWDGNLVLFLIALVVLGVLVLMNVSGYWLLPPAAVMLVTFLAGIGFTSYIPNVHLAEFADALRHREILLMVDVSIGQAASVEKLIRRHHPGTVTGGVGWHVDALQIQRQVCQKSGPYIVAVRYRKPRRYMTMNKEKPLQNRHKVRYEELNWVASSALPRDREQSRRLHEPDHLIGTIDPMTGHDILDVAGHPSIVDGNLTIYFESVETKAAFEQMPLNHPYEHALGKPAEDMDRGG